MLMDGFFSKKLYAAKTERTFITKLNTLRCLECISCATFLSSSLMVRLPISFLPSSVRVLRDTCHRTVLRWCHSRVFFLLRQVRCSVLWPISSHILGVAHLCHAEKMDNVFLSHLIYSFFVIYGNTQSFFYAINSTSKSKSETWVKSFKIIKFHSLICFYLYCLFIVSCRYVFAFSAIVLASL